MKDMRMVSTAYRSRVGVTRKDVYAFLRRNQLGLRPYSLAGSDPTMRLLCHAKVGATGQCAGRPNSLQGFLPLGSVVYEKCIYQLHW